MKVLFVGNSHTYFHDMPALFARFVAETTGEKPQVTMLAYSGRDYAWHRREYFSLRFNLMYGNYDYCILQQAAHPYPPAENTLESGRELIDLCHRMGATPVVYMTWAEKRFPENQQKMIDTCGQLARENRAMLAPVGQVWQKIVQECPDIDLYHRDGEHAGIYGAFLIAATFCKVLTGDVAPTVSGMGFNFLDDTPLDFDNPTVVEEREQISCPLDMKKTDRILAAVREVVL